MSCFLLSARTARHSAVVRVALSRFAGVGAAQSELKLVSPRLALGHAANFSRTVRSANERVSTQTSRENATSTGHTNGLKAGAGNKHGQQPNNTGQGMGGTGSKTTRTQMAAPPNDAGIAEKPSKGDNSPRPAPNHTDERASDSIKIASYVGARRNRLPHGQGKAKYADDSTYEGEFADGKAHGRGTWYSACGTMSHTGEWKEGKRHGQGTSTMDDVTLKGVWPINLTNKHLANYTVSYTDGLTFKGNFTALTKRHLKNAKLTGTGTIKYPDRSVYTGAFEKGLRQGQGKTVDAKGKVLYEGLYDQDLPVTEASLDAAAAAAKAAVAPVASTAKATKVNEDATEADYQGDLMNGVRHGYGTLTDYDAGFTYEGNFQHGVPHGEGRCQYSNGAVYEGTWIQGVRTGPGTYFDRHGNRLTGTWLGRRLEPNTQEYEVYVTSTQTTYVGAFGRMKLKREHDDVRVPSGEGKIRYSNGWVYTGTIVEGQPKSAAARAAGPASSTATEKVGGGGARGTQQSR
jgi:hypothetical protein